MSTDCLVTAAETSGQTPPISRPELAPISTRRALLIGSQTGGLKGVANDVARLEAVLAPLGFQVTKLLGADATRDGILTGYRALIAAVHPADVVFIYYSGHGGAAHDRSRVQTLAEAGPQDVLQFIVPTDFEQSTDADFRGIASVELSSLLAELTSKVTNVTVALDCCHATRMSRSFGLNLVPKAYPGGSFPGIAAHIQRIQPQLTAIRDGQSNPNAVRLVAADFDQSAFEYTNSAGQPCGLFTESLELVLKEAVGSPVSWESIGRRILERVAAVAPGQRPTVEGPSTRVLFETRTVDLTGVLSYFVHPSAGPSLRGGKLLGVEVGDEYLLMPANVDVAAPEKALASAVVVKVQGTQSRVALTLNGAHPEVLPGVLAFPHKKGYPRRPVRVGPDDSSTTSRTVVPIR